MLLLLLFCLQISCFLGCLSTYTILSGSRTLYYNSATGSYTPALVLPESEIHPSFMRDPEAKWVWWTITWTTATVYFKDSFGLAQWAVERLNTAVLKIAGEDWIGVTFNGELLKNYDSSLHSTAFLAYNIKGKLKGSSSTKYEENVLEVTVGSNGYYEGLLYRIEFTFN